MSKVYLGNQKIGSVYVGSSFQGRMEMYEDSYVKNPYTWDAVIANCARGKYASIYKIGDTVPLDLGSEGIVNMEIVGIDVDELADGSGVAPLTWISKELLGTNKRMNPELVTNYSYPEAASWAATSTSGEWKTTTAYCAGTTAEATWTITATTVGTLTISYKVGSTNASRNKMALMVNGEAVITDYCGSTSYVSHTVEMAAGDVVTVYASYYLNYTSSAYYGYVKFASTGIYTISADISNAETRVFESLSENTGSIGGWPKTEMRTYMNGTIKNLIPENVRTGIKTVNKTYYGYKNSTSSSGTSFRDVCADDCWIPSYREIFGGTSYENSGPIYSAVFNSAETRKKTKYNSSSTSYWWLRSAAGASTFRCVYTSGGYSYINAHGSNGVALGFCT